MHSLLEEMLEEFNNQSTLKIVETLEEGLTILDNSHFDIILYRFRITR